MSSTGLSHNYDQLLAILGASRTQLEVVAANHLEWPALMRIRQQALLRAGVLLAEVRTPVKPASSPKSRQSRSSSTSKRSLVHRGAAASGGGDVLSQPAIGAGRRPVRSALPSQGASKPANAAKEPSSSGSGLVSYQDEPPAKTEDTPAWVVSEPPPADPPTPNSGSSNQDSLVSFDAPEPAVASEGNPPESFDLLGSSQDAQQPNPKPSEPTTYTGPFAIQDQPWDAAPSKDKPSVPQPQVDGSAPLVFQADAATPAPKAREAKSDDQEQATPVSPTRARAPASPAVASRLGASAPAKGDTAPHSAGAAGAAPAATKGAGAAGVAVATAASGRKGASKQRSARAASIPTIREHNKPPPSSAAAIRLNADGAGVAQVIGLEEEHEPLEMAAAEAPEEDEASDMDGMSLVVEEYEDDLDEPSEEPEPIEPEPAMPVLPGQDEVKQLLDKAREVAESGDLDAAVLHFTDVLEADPDCLEALIARGRLYLDLGDYARAMSDFTMAEDLSPRDPDTQVAIGDLHFARKDYGRAIGYFDSALNVDPSHAMAFCRRGISHYYRKNYTQALDDLLQAQKHDNDIPNIGTYIAMAKRKK